jgi:dsDNA-specific endonuclease/ATPase MutS2
MNSILVLLIGVLGGSFGVELIKSLFGLSKIKFDDATKIRAELHTEVTTLRQEIRSLQKDLDYWKGEYYTLLQKYNEEKEAWKQKYFELQEQRDQEKDQYQSTLNQIQEKYNKANSELETLRKLCTLPTPEPIPSP